MRILSLQEQYRFSIFYFAWLIKYLKNLFESWGDIVKTKVPKDTSFYQCGPTRIRTSVNGFGDRYSTTEL